MKYILNWKEYEEKARQAVAEGIVLVENNNDVLPFRIGDEVAVFGRMQAHYYKSGTGSGGMVNVYHVTDMLEGLRESGIVSINEELAQIYEAWNKANPVDRGLGWGMEPWSQPEMPVDDELVENAAKKSDVALVIIARTAGEDKDSTATEGSYLLTELELDMMSKVRAHFSKMVVLLNVGGIIDMNFVDSIKPDAVVYGWQGGMVGGHGTADVLTGKVCPSGRLTDTIAYELSDYYADKNFGDVHSNTYVEDIYVGYRYFETFAEDRVRYPFGYGLSYTDFDTKCEAIEFNIDKREAIVRVCVKNVGCSEGKQVVQLYASAPQGKLGKPKKALVGFDKTDSLKKGESQILEMVVPFYTFASYDDSGITGNRSCYVLEQGEYIFYLGDNVRDAVEIGKIYIEDMVLDKLSQALAPVCEFERLRPDCDMKQSLEKAPTAAMTQEEKRLAKLPAEYPITGDMGIKLRDVYEENASMKDFISQLSEDDLSCIIRGEGMGSSLVTPGTASAFGGVSKTLRDYGIPAVCCDDGPSGMRFDSGAEAFSLPIGTLLGCTFNRKLNTELFEYTSLEMVANKVECLLGPGMNIHRHVLNGRNFEYFSEDPYLTGEIAISQLKGLKKYQGSGTVKHFCANNQELGRRFVDAVVSERALREIYLKGFEMAVRSGYCDSVMTTYGRVNGLYTAGIYDLNTTILREEWGFKGVVMTDWWAAISMDGTEAGSKTDFATMVRAQNDLYMVCPDGSKNVIGDNTLDALEKGEITIGELQRCAANICGFAMKTQAMKRLIDNADEVEIIERPIGEDFTDVSDVEYLVLEDELVIPLDDRKSVKDTSYVIALDASKPGDYRITLRGSSMANEVAQMTCTLFINGFPISTMTFHGTNGELDCVIRDLWIMQRFAVLRLKVGADGLDLKDISFRYLSEHKGGGSFIVERDEE